MLTATGLGIMIPILVVTAAGGPEPPGCAVSDSHGRCLVIAVDPGRPGRPAAPEPDDASERSVPGNVRSDEASGPPPRPLPPFEAFPVGDGGWSAQGVPDFSEFLDAEPPAEPDQPVEPEVDLGALVQRAVEELTLSPPVLRTSVAGSGYVGVPVWLWIEGDVASTGPVSATATAGAARVTATGRLSAVEWSMGPPGGTVLCAGPGTPWDGQTGSSPDCGYTYEQRSLSERTDGSGRWPVTATSMWTVTWTGVSGGVPVAGEETVRVSAESSLGVGEVQVLVGGVR